MSALESQTGWLLRARDLSVSYGNGVVALQPTQLDLAPGAFTVLLGSSGAGKSTLLRAMNGLVQPSAGCVQLADLTGDLSQRAVLREHRRRTGMIFQQHHLIGRCSVLDNVLTGRLGWRQGWRAWTPWSRADRRLALAALDRVGLLDKALERADALSGGQQQRVGIARALVQQPRLMLADEPVASLDPVTAVQVLAQLHAICQSDRLTAVVSLHQVELARRFADRIVGLRAGRVVFDGPPSALDAAAATALYAPAAGLAGAPSQPPMTAPTPELAT